MAPSSTKILSLQELAELTESELLGDASLLIHGVGSLEEASVEEVSFLANLKYKEAMKRSKAGAIFISPDAERLPGQNYLIHPNPSLAFQKAVEFFLLTSCRDTGFIGIHPTAVIHPSAVLGSDVQIGPCVSIDQGVVIGEGTRIYSHVSIGPGSHIGKQCIIHPHVTIREQCFLGDRVVIQPGSVIGSCGFGFSTDARGVHTKLDQLGCVIIEDDVEIGANTTIDRARFRKTCIGKGTKIDNLVQIGHNVCLGPHNLIVSQTGISGSTTTGRNVVLGGQCGVVGHIHITDGVMVASKGGVSKSISQPGKYAGVPVLPIEEHNRQQVLLRKIALFAKRLDHVEQTLKSSN
ncbi:MAG: UDP-3-O-(3-hydroxymyristoyl)glucosamine N-acyltransferase [Chlamydiae bacterium]|nr:UDP-3-O-(3-hydroxymyristoyl)glucosamine N-acyltransferase [Chlamydiota bacterium]